MNTSPGARFTFEAVYPEVADILAEIELALVEAIPAAIRFHTDHALDRRADPHCFSHIIRRIAMERLKDLDPDLELQDNVGQAMSGVIVHVVSEAMDCRFSIRTYKAFEGGPPIMDTRPRTSFCTQDPSAQGQLRIGDHITPASICNLIALWDTDGLDLTLLRLIRPWGVDARGWVREDWNESILGVSSLKRYPVLEDLPYRTGADVEVAEDGRVTS